MTEDEADDDGDCERRQRPERRRPADVCDDGAPPERQVDETRQRDDDTGGARYEPRALTFGAGQVPGDELPIGEDRPLRPHSPYGASKAAADLISLQTFLGRGLGVIRARPFNHLGPWLSPISRN